MRGGLPVDETGPPIDVGELSIDVRGPTVDVGIAY